MVLKYVLGLAFHHEVNGVDFVTLDVDILALIGDNGLEVWTEPRDERLRPLFQKLEANPLI